MVVQLVVVVGAYQKARIWIAALAVVGTEAVEEYPVVVGLGRVVVACFGTVAGVAA